jgi:hypothetical protein
MRLHQRRYRADFFNGIGWKADTSLRLTRRKAGLGWYETRTFNTPVAEIPEDHMITARFTATELRNLIRTSCGLLAGLTGQRRGAVGTLQISKLR